MSDIVIRPVASREELAEAWEIIGAQFAPPLTREDRRLADLVRRFAADRLLMLIAEVDGSLVGGALGFRTSPETVTLRAVGLQSGVRRRGLGRQLLEATEDAARRLGVGRIDLGADEAVGFYAHLGYSTVLMLQWVHDPEAADAEIAQLERGCLAGLNFTRNTFGGIPQLFAPLPSPRETLARTTERDAPGCVAGFAMFKQL